MKLHRRVKNLSVRLLNYLQNVLFSLCTFSFASLIKSKWDHEILNMHLSPNRGIHTIIVWLLSRRMHMFFIGWKINCLCTGCSPTLLSDPCPSPRGLLSQRVKRAVLVSSMLLCFVFFPLPCSELQSGL